MTNPVENTTGCYDRQATEYQEASERHMARIRLNTVNHALLEMKSSVPRTGLIVDLGCGTGHSTEMIRSVFESTPTMGIDCSSAEIEIAIGRSKARDLNLEYHVDDFFQRDYASDSVALFVAVMSIHYFRDPVELTRLLKRLSTGLIDKGRLVAQIPNPELPFPYRDYGITHSAVRDQSGKLKEGDAYDVSLFSKPYRHWQSDWGEPLVTFQNYVHSWETFSSAFSAAGFSLQEQKLVIPADLLRSECEINWDDLGKQPIYRTLVATKTSELVQE